MNLKNGLLKPLKINHGGVRLNHHKIISYSPDPPTFIPEKVRIPMSMHIGAPCEPVVKVKDQVNVGQLIGDSKGFVSSPIHASVSGTVKSIQVADVASSGSKTTIVEIVSDGKMELYEELKPPVIHSKEDFIAAVRASGLVGLGGAGFPTSVKLSVKEGEVDTLIANGAECEPYITVDDYAMHYRQEELLDAMVEIMHWINIPNGIVAIENNKLESAELLLDKINANPEKYKNIKIFIMESVYPKGMEKIVIYNVLGREVPAGKLPKDVGCVVMNTTSLMELGKYLKTGIPLVNKLITVDGTAIANTQNVLVPIGTIISDLLDFVGLNEEPKLLMMGGPMMGVALADKGLSVLKQNNAILAMLEGEFDPAKESPCIRCSKCVDACPMCLQPTTIVKAIKQGNFQKALSYDLLTCMECGSCDYVCPAKIPLVQYMRYGKSQIKK